jgi:signal transduction histidine kinase
MQSKTVTSSMLPVGELITSDERVSPHINVTSVAERFFGTTELDAIAVVDGEIPVGLVTRTKLLFTLFRRFGFELYGRHSIISLADTKPLILAEDKPLTEVIDSALERPPQDIYDEIIVTHANGAYRGLLSVKQLVIQQSNALASSILQKEIASARALELEKISELKSQFLANVTHELRSPVNAIIGLAELLRMAANKNSIEQIKERLSLMILSATNLRTIITNILDLSKIEAGKMTVLCQPVDVTALITEIADTTRILVGNKPVSVKVSIPITPVTITTDPIKLRQIITNLASNAAKFTESGEITILLNIIGGSLEIAVGDTGLGIKEEDLNRLFTAFGQIEDAKTKQHAGTGLGLTISKNLAELIGGSISVSSTFGKGSTFTVLLPLHNN